MRIEAEKFISHHLRQQTNLKALSFVSMPWEGSFKRDILQTLDAYHALKDKVPSWFNVSGLWFTSKKSIEQASSEKTALFKADIVQNLNVQYGVDLTGGLGVDTFFMAQKTKNWCYVDSNKDLAERFRINVVKLGVNHIRIYDIDAANFLCNEAEECAIDFIYVDPDRRPDSLNRRAVGFEESLPTMSDIVAFADKKSIPLLVKSSPMIDINAGLKVVPAQSIYVISVKNEVKEILWLYHPKQKDLHDITIETHELAYDWQPFCASLTQKTSASVINDFNIDTFVIIPSAGIMKAGLNDLLATQNNWSKAADFTHIYFASSEPESRIPIRTFKPIQELPTSPKKFKKCGVKKANVLCRNSPLSPTAFKNKYAIIEGGDQFILCFRDLNNKMRIVLAEQINA